MTDAQIAREWAEGFIKYADRAEIVDADTLTAARHILATTTPPTMADVEWDNDVHAGLCALYAYGDLVRMIGPDLDSEDVIICHYIHYGSPVTVGLLAEKLTPIPGTKINLTPRREPEPESTPEPDQPRPEDVPEGELWLVEVDGQQGAAQRELPGAEHPWWLMRGWRVSDKEVTLVSRLVPERVPSHPTVLTTEADYQDAPAGTIVEGALPWAKSKDGRWETFGVGGWVSSSAMSGEARRVLRWGLEA